MSVVLFGELQREGFFDHEGKAKWLLSFVLEGKGVDGQGSGTMSVHVKWGKDGGGAGSDQLANESDRHGYLGSL